MGNGVDNDKVIVSDRVKMVRISFFEGYHFSLVSRFDYANGAYKTYTYDALDRLTAGYADGFMTGGLCALGGSVIGGAARTVKNAKSGITLEKTGQFDKAAELVKT